MLRRLIILGLLIYIVYRLLRRVSSHPPSPRYDIPPEPTPPVNQAYTLLGLDPNASDEAIKTAYRDLSKRYHPDTVAHEPEHIQRTAADMMAKINGAYHTLKKERSFR